jgi:two-component system KDP operon response regulator KdpE
MAGRELELDDSVRAYLDMHEYVVLQAGDGAEALIKVRTSLPDLVVLDAMISDMEDLEALREIRSLSDVPIIILSDKCDEDAKIHALHLGADDYLTKPVSPRELSARIESALRRAGHPALVPLDALVVDDDLTIDFPRNRVVRHGAEEALTATEHRLLYHLVTNAGRLVPYEALLARVWGSEYREEVHYVRLYVRYLRAKLEPDSAHPKYIMTEKGLGYRFADFGGARESLALARAGH